MRILFLAGRELDYSRNDVLLRACRRLGEVDVVGEYGPGSILWRSGRVYLRSLPRLVKKRYDLIFIGFYGHLLMLLLGYLTRTPILFDAFLSTYDTLVSDRNLFKPSSFFASLSRWLDQKSCRLARLVLLDTTQHVDYFVSTFGLPVKKCAVLPVGCNEDIFFPQPPSKHDNSVVLFYSTYLPLHGAETVVKAASVLSSVSDLTFRLIGNGQTYNQSVQMASELNINNITFVPSVPVLELAKEIACTDICLGGHFGISTKAGRVIPGKIYQLLAMGKPIIAADTPANRSLLTHGKSAYLCPPDDPQSLASSILQLYHDTGLCQKLAAGARQLYENQCSEAVITNKLNDIIKTIAGNKG